MEYCSTRNTGITTNSARAIAQGLSFDGGLFAPVSIPALSDADIESLLNMSYPERAAFITGKYLTDYSGEELLALTESIFENKFTANGTAPCECNSSIGVLGSGTVDLRVKDLRRRFRVSLTSALKKLGEPEVCILSQPRAILKAALEGFADVGVQNRGVFPEGRR